MDVVFAGLRRARGGGPLRAGRSQSLVRVGRCVRRRPTCAFTPSTRAIAGFVSMGKSTSTIDKVSELANSLPSVERVVVISSSGKEFDASEWPASIRDKVIGWEAFLDGGDEDPVFTRVPFSHPQFVLYSSGTTGMPKSIAHGCGNTLLQHGKELILHGDLREGDKMLFYTYLPASEYRSVRDRTATPSSRRRVDGVEAWKTPRYFDVCTVAHC